MRNLKTRNLNVLGHLVVFGLVVIMAPTRARAGEIPEAVQLACSDDYQKHCIKHQPGSDAGHECMADAFEKLSETCVTAILNSDLVNDGPEPSTDVIAVAENTVKPEKKVRRTGKARKKRRVRTARSSRKYRVRSRRNDARKSRRRYSRIERRISRGLRIADRHVSRALARAFRF
jgi:hypothetical protein